VDATFTGANGKSYPTDGCIPDTINHVRFVRDLYERVDPAPRRYTVPVLWDKKKGTIVSEESADIVRTLNTGFRQLVSSDVDLVPVALEAELNAVNDGIVAEVGGAYYKTLLASDDAAKKAAFAVVDDALARLNDILATRRFFIGKGITEVDIRLFHTLIRLDSSLTPAYKDTLTKHANVVAPRADAEFPAEKDRYHLYVAYACPFACRALSARNLLGLEDLISLSVVHPVFQKTRPDDPTDSHLGWTFVDPAVDATFTGANGKSYSTDGCIPDTINHVRFVRDLYERVDPAPRPYSVPVLWDKKKGTIVSGESADIVRTLNTGFRQLVSSDVDLVPVALEAELNAANNGIVAEISGAYFKTLLASDDAGKKAAFALVDDGLARLNDILATRRFFIGKGITEVDIRLFHTLIRLDSSLASSHKDTITKHANVVA
ncbi:hypothetical protein HK405_013528, partial [Cladochytrium tenue]